jgi:hypothetical protein
MSNRKDSSLRSLNSSLCRCTVGMVRCGMDTISSTAVVYARADVNVLKVHRYDTTYSNTHAYNESHTVVDYITRAWYDSYSSVTIASLLS